MMTDPIADMLTRIRNAVRVERPSVDMPTSKVKRGLAEVLKREGYIWDWKEIEADPVPWNPLEKEAKVSKPLPWSTIVVPLLSSATRNAHKNGTGLETSVGQSGPEFRLQEEAR